MSVDLATQDSQKRAVAKGPEEKDREKMACEKEAGSVRVVKVENHAILSTSFGADM